MIDMIYDSILSSELMKSMSGLRTFENHGSMNLSAWHMMIMAV